MSDDLGTSRISNRTSTHATRPTPTQRSRKARAQDDYNQALRQLEQQGLAGRRDTDTSLLSRGVYNSGEAVRRRDDLTKALTQGREQADVTYPEPGETSTPIGSGRSRSSSMQREREIAASRPASPPRKSRPRGRPPLQRFRELVVARRAAVRPQRRPRRPTPPQSPMLLSSNESGVGYSTAGARTGSTYNTSTGGGKPVGVPAFNTSRKPTPKPYSKPKVVQY